MDMAFRSPTRVTVLHQGRVLADGSRDEISANDLVQQAYLGAVDGSSRQFTVQQLMLELVDIHTYYGDSHVLQGVTLRASAAR